MSRNRSSRVSGLRFDRGRNATGALLLSALFLMGGSANSVAQDMPPPAVVVEPVALVDVGETAVFNGRLEAEKRVAIRPRVAGTLENIDFQPGDRVNKGDILFQIDDDLYAAAVKEAEGAVRSAEALQKSAELERERQAELVKRQATSQAMLDNAIANLGNADGALIRARAALERAELNLSYTSVEAPFAGRLSAATVDEGALIGPEGGPLVALTQLDPIHVIFPVPTAIYRDYSERVQAGEASTKASVNLVLANGSEYSLPGDLDFIESTVSPGTDSINLRARFDNADGVLLDQELVRVVLASSEPEPQLTVDQRSVLHDLSGTYVMVVNGENVVEQRRVEIDRTVGGRSVIRTGVTEGENVITDGLNKVRPGIVVDAALASGS
ncbi:efflux RND transporter periplasmic adaptor subunit [Nitratireductor aquimarinus]|uniref:efflux RND transporter periplasmic adaptor subunit n=1 Tax=Nitratireductor aquimarinus TaxID=889300 RepID=UPI001A8D3358|nr:efflux RND transporter periplasmic adaptor subunit [Nitratireductor aquimarinus]MBN8243114.1 efflux RND transporter periplasmic adaptor subunit [Nitratireductor aquimarinus]MBY6131015.1 efflux RND transporter periplasmic adaptor subunit [Nitratireductor aquimarinus]MCA1302229.1 efflux RND transporter periplasmic adaptor subunit [Nitratireductor aquimarinus]